MTDRPYPRQSQLEELLRRFGAALRGAQLYAPGHPLVARNVASFTDVVQRLLEDVPAVSIALIADEVVVGDVPLPRGAATLGELFNKLKSRGVERVSIDRGVTIEEMVSTVDALCRRLQSAGDPDDIAFPDLPHVRIGLVRIEERSQASVSDMATIRKLYTQACSTMRTVWENAARDGVTKATRELQRSGVIHYHRGHIAIINRAGLEARCCECYGVVKRESDRLLRRSADLAGLPEYRV